ncbi:MAG: ABC transporter substrate-binding protein [Candidimonas sp.]|nr:MAG: ABC transporter substrate-binding protein [Candidimonas sp.]
MEPARECSIAVRRGRRFEISIVRNMAGFPRGDIMKRLAQAALAGVAIFALEGVAQATKSDNTIIWTTAAEVDTTDVYYQNQREVVITALNMCDSLLHLNPTTYKYQPLLAESYKWVNPTTLDFKLRKGIKFWNGKDFGAKDVAYTLNLVRQPDSGMVVRQLVDWIKDVKVVGPYEVQIIAKQPTPAALAYLADESPIYPQGHYDNAPALPGATGTSARKDYGAVRPMCTGPYMLKNFKSGSGFTLVKNPNYFKGGPKGQPHIGKLIFRTIPDTDSQMAALLTHDVDWIWSVLPQNVKQLQSVPGIKVDAAPTMRISFLSLDAAGRTGENPMQKLKVRQAIAHAIDRESLVKNLVGPGAKVLKSMCAPQQTGCTEDVPQYDYDPALAKKLLAEAGYPNGFDEVLYAYRDRPYTEAVMNYLRAVGIRTKLRYLQWKALQPVLRKGDIRMGHLTWGSQSVMDASASTGYYFEFTDDDYARDKQVRDWLVAADRTVDPAKRDALYKEALTRIAQQAYYIPLFLYGHIYAFDSNLDYPVTPDELAHFYMARWK